MKSSYVRLLSLLTLSLLLPAFAWAQAPATDDSYYKVGNSTNHGMEPILNVQAPSVNALLRFTLNGYPTGLSSSAIQKATLKLFANSNTTSAGTFYVCRLASNQNWIEDTVTGLNAPGCDLSTTPVSVAVPTGATLQYFVIDVTSIVQYWFANSGSNNGIGLWSINPNHGTSGTVVVSFNSKEATDTSHDPELDIVLTSGSGGSTGATGATGATGSTGPTGATGATGPSGGPKGPTGPTGPTGPAGAKGATGATGITGIGVQGPTGSTGAAGAAGAKGATGATGTNGSAGINGLNGATGPTGATGAAGQGFNFKGAWSPASSYNQYDVVTFGGQTYEVSNPAGVGANPTFNPGSWSLWAQMGAPGATGPAGTGGSGSTGPTGPTGPTGATGANGTTGAAGATGATGATGAVGAAGATGTAGATGATGAASTVPGPMGATGPMGPAGPTGATGAASLIPGPAGTNGTNGTNGATGDRRDRARI